MESSPLAVNPIKLLTELPDPQGCAVSRYSLGRACIEALFRLGLGLERHIYWCQSVSKVEKIHFAFTNDTFCVSTGLKTVPESVLKDTLMCVKHNLGDCLSSFDVNKSYSNNPDGPPCTF